MPTLRMTDRLPNLSRFIRRARRRMMILRAAEAMALGILGGCVFSAIVVGILLVRGRPAFAVASQVLAIAAGVGLAWAMLRRPRPLAIAIEADRQLGLHDLLSTAWVMSARDHADDPFVTAIFAAAEARCGATSPSSIIMNRLGARAWGGIGLATALVLTVAGMSANPTSTPAQTSRQYSLATASALPPADAAGPRPLFDPAHTTFIQPPRSTDGAADPDANDPDPTSSNDPAMQGANPAAGNSSNTAGGTNGAGSGSARSQDPVHSDPLTPRGSDPANPRTGSNTGSGTGAPIANGAGPGNPAGAHAGDDPSRQAAPPWQGSSWSSDAAAAIEAVTAGQVPARYRDLVRAYFERRN